MLSLIAAMDRNGVIGKSGKIPWHLPADFLHFKSLTMGHPVIIGRSTFLSLGKPLSGRTNIVLSREERFFPGCLSAKSLKEAIALANKDNQEKNGDDIAYVIGGGQVYALAMPLADCLEITHVGTEIKDGDTFFPNIDIKNVWKEISRTHYPANEKNVYNMDFVTYVRCQ